MKRFTFVLVVLLAFAGVATAAKPKPNLSVKKVSSPPQSAKAGDTFEVDGVVANKGKRRGKARVKLTLRETPKGNPVAQIGSAKVKVKPKSKKRFSTEAKIPAGAGAPSADYDEYVEAGGYRLVACVKKRGNKGKQRCKAAKGTVTIEAQTNPPPNPAFTPGARTLGDPLLPQIGNGGYDAQHYAIDLEYDRPTNTFEAGTETVIAAKATQDLSEFSLDFQDDLDVSEVLVNGTPAQFAFETTTPDLGPDPITQPTKLVVTPAAGIVDGSEFTVEVAYTGEPPVFTDPDTSIEGWIPGCYTVASVQTCDSNFVVGEPMGSQAWFPSNNFPSDKATFETTITVQTGDEAFGLGELVEPPVDNGDGTTTWSWIEDDPTATYLATASNGDFTYDETTASETATSRTIPVYNAIDPSATILQTQGFNTLVGRNSALLDFLGARFGPYPFDSYGAIYDRTSGIGYALEVQTKSHFSSLPSSAQLGSVNGSNASTYLHELMHSWFGNAVTLKNWNDIWFNEGWAQFSEWEYAYEFAGGTTTPTQEFDALYNNPGFDWSLAPAELGGDPANLFNGDATYARGGMVIQGFRDILADDPKFFDFAKAIQTQFAYGNISTEEFIEFAKQFSGFTGSRLALLDIYFEQWLYGTTRPTIAPDDF